MTTFEKLQARIQKDIGLKLVRFRRTYSGRNQRACGAWVWVAYDSESPSRDIGSIYSATELLKNEKPLTLSRFVAGYSQEIENN